MFSTQPPTRFQSQWRKTKALTQSKYFIDNFKLTEKKFETNTNIVLNKNDKTPTVMYGFDLTAAQNASTFTNSSSFVGLTSDSNTLGLFGRSFSKDNKIMTEGQFVNGQPNGFARVISSGKYVFEGQVLGSAQNGLGTYTFVDGTTKTSYSVGGVEYVS